MHERGEMRDEANAVFAHPSRLQIAHYLFLVFLVQVARIPSISVGRRQD
jgi:hypothetical protein